ncbi:MAG TPA: hypothetical protein VGR29_07155 [Thermomicrobiales bacterium]|nr:hypothetical protein [Thermomicrobiales bacterium]
MSTTQPQRASRGRSRVLACFTVLMFLLSLMPAAASAMPALTTDQFSQLDAQTTLAQTGSFIEVHVSACETGATGTAQELRDLCHENGVAGVQMDITSVDPALGVNLVDKTTERINDAGPGITNTGTIPAGEYLIDVDLPGDGNRFVVGCEFFDREEIVPATPADAQEFRVTVPQGEDIVCDLFIIPQNGTGANAAVQPAQDLASLDFTVRYCDRTDLTGDDRSFDALSANCTTVPAPPTAPPVPISLSIGMPGGEVSTRPLDAEGSVTFADLPNGNYPVFSNVDRDNAGEYLFCTYEGQPRYEKTFDANGTTTFTNLLGEEIACDWFVVYVPQEAPPPPADQAASITANLVSCPRNYDVAANGEDAAAFATNCTAPAADVLMTLTGTDGTRTEVTSTADGVAAFPNLEPDTYTLFSGIPLEAASEYVFCMGGDGVETREALSDRGVATLEDIGTSQIECTWYIVPEDLRGEETGATVTVHLAACPVEYAGDQFYADCHANGVADQQYTLSGPNGEVTATTTMPADPGPGVATFTELPAGEYTLAGGPPQDFGSVALYCSDPATNQPIGATMEGGKARFSVAEQQSVLCDWYFIPVDARGEVTPTPTPAQAQRAEILVTLFGCKEGTVAAGATFAQLDEACNAPINGVPFSLGIPGGTPLTANTGVSGEGAVRFYELRPGDYVMTPSLPANYTSAAVYCQIGDGDVYQKSLQSGSTNFVDLDGEQMACSWFANPVKQVVQQPAGPTGSITVREFLCEGDRGSIKDWERECVPGATDTAFTLASSDGAVTRNATPNQQGVLVFAELPDGYYELTQDDGVWCKAAAERVDSRSRVIVRDGGNTDVFIYECGQVTNLPDTGSGTARIGGSSMQDASVLLAALAIPAFAAALWQLQRTKPEPVRVRAIRSVECTDPSDGGNRIRFR